MLTGPPPKFNGTRDILYRWCGFRVAHLTTNHPKAVLPRGSFVILTYDLAQQLDHVEGYFSMSA
jgi:hypothetical protein